MKWFGWTLLILGFLATPKAARATGQAPDVFTTPCCGGPFVGDTGVLSFSASGFSGLFRAVDFSDPSNVFCTGCVDLLFEIFNNPSSTTGLTRLTTADLSSLLTDVGFTSVVAKCLNGPCIAPSTVDRSTNGALIGLNFASGSIGAGGESSILEIQTNTTKVPAGLVWTVFGANGASTTVAPTPEPGTLVLMGSGLLGLAARLRRRFLHRVLLFSACSLVLHECLALS